jgi:hypothetical protein
MMVVNTNTTTTNSTSRRLFSFYFSKLSPSQQHERPHHFDFGLWSGTWQPFGQSTSRSLKNTENDSDTAMALECDLADPTGVEKVFETVRGAWGEPSVVVYNGMKPLIL